MSDEQTLLSADAEPFVPTGTPDPLPEGEVFEASPDTWYNLRVHYKDDKGNPLTGLMYPLASNPATSFYEYMVLGSSPMGLPPVKLRLKPRPDGWAIWEIDWEGGIQYLSLKLTGWAYRASNKGYAIGWQIVDNKLYNEYWSKNWKGFPAGWAHRSTLVPDAYYVGVSLPQVFICELIPAS